MFNLAEIRGQERVVAQLRRALAQDRVAHAYLFVGPPGVGKYQTGLALAATLNCTERAHPSDQPACGACDSCLKIAAGQHPDVQTLERQGAARIIPIETIRQQVIPRLAGPPHEGRVRVFLIEEATSLQGPSANALLKTLEEPPPRTHFILATSAPDQLLPTIRSRCQRIGFAAVAVTGDQPDETAVRIESLVDGLVQAISGGAQARFAAAAEAGRERAEVVPTLRLLGQRLHREACQAARDNQPSRAALLSRQATRVLEAETAVAIHNAHGQLAFEHLLSQLGQMAGPP